MIHVQMILIIISILFIWCLGFTITKKVMELYGDEDNDTIFLFGIFFPLTWSVYTFCQIIKLFLKTSNDLINLVMDIFNNGKDK